MGQNMPVLVFSQASAPVFLLKNSWVGLSGKTLAYVIHTRTYYTYCVHTHTYIYIYYNIYIYMYYAYCTPQTPCLWIQGPENSFWCLFGFMPRQINTKLGIDGTEQYIYQADTKLFYRWAHGCAPRLRGQQVNRAWKRALRLQIARYQDLSRPTNVRSTKRTSQRAN